VPGEDALGRFLAKLVAHEDLVEACFESIMEKLRQLLPGFGKNLVVNSTDIKAFSNGRRRLKSDPDARWGTPTCSCGLEMAFWGRDGNYLKYRCPPAAGKGVCRDLSPCTHSAYGYVLKLPIKDDIRRHPPVPRETKKWKRLYRLRTSIERVNSRLKELLGLGRITLRGMAKILLRSLLSLLVMVAAAVGMAQRHRFREVRSLVS
jgi:hypothetical protein